LSVLRCRWPVRIAPTRAQFAHFSGECFKPETRWRSGVDSNSRFRLFSAKSGNFLYFPSSRESPRAVSGGNGDRTMAAWRSCSATDSTPKDCSTCHAHRQLARLRRGRTGGRERAGVYRTASRRSWRGAEGLDPVNGRTEDRPWPDIGVSVHSSSGGSLRSFTRSRGHA